MNKIFIHRAWGPMTHFASVLVAAATVVVLVEECILPLMIPYLAVRVGRHHLILGRHLELATILSDQATDHQI